MCRTEKTLWGCGHRTSIFEPCIYRDSRVSGWFGRSPCQKLNFFEYARGLSCDTCRKERRSHSSVTPISIPHHNTPIVIDEIMVLILRNESYLAKRLRRCTLLKAVPVPSSSGCLFAVASDTTVRMQILINDELLARHAQRCGFDAHNSGRLRYSDFLDLYSYHTHLKRMLNYGFIQVPHQELASGTRSVLTSKLSSHTFPESFGDKSSSQRSPFLCGSYMPANDTPAQESSVPLEITLVRGSNARYEKSKSAASTRQVPRFQDSHKIVGRWGLCGTKPTSSSSLPIPIGPSSVSPGITTNRARNNIRRLV
jgi:hypothetical protein